MKLGTNRFIKKVKTNQKKKTSKIGQVILISVLLIFVFLYLSLHETSVKQSQLQIELNRKLSTTPTKHLYFIPIPSSDKVSKNKPSNKIGWRTYENYIAGYAIDFPDTLNIYEENAKNTGWDSTSGSICLTENKIIEEYKTCPKGLQVFYSVPYIDGKGGMGCGEFETKIQIGNSFYKTCMNNETMNGGGNFYLKHPTKKSEIGFNAVFSKQFNKQLVLEIFKTFKFIK